MSLMIYYLIILESLLQVVDDTVFYFETNFNNVTVGGLHVWFYTVLYAFV